MKDRMAEPMSPLLVGRKGCNEIDVPMMTVSKMSRHLEWLTAAR